MTDRERVEKALREAQEALSEIVGRQVSVSALVIDMPHDTMGIACGRLGVETKPHMSALGCEWQGRIQASAYSSLLILSAWDSMEATS